MFGWAALVACTVPMVRGRRGGRRERPLWRSVSSVLCLVSGSLIPLPLTNTVIGLVLSYAALVAGCPSGRKVRRKRHRPPLRPRNRP